MLKKPYEQLIPRLERDAIEAVLGMDSGYVLDFSDRTFDDFFFETVSIDASAQSHLFSGRGTSKAKRLRSFIENASPHLVAKILREFWEHREARKAGFSYGIPVIDEKTQSLYFSAIARIEGLADHIDTCPVYTSDAPDEPRRGDPRGRRNREGGTGPASARRSMAWRSSSSNSTGVPGSRSIR